MKKVEIYTVDYCPYCNKAKEILTEHKIPFIEVNITENEQEGREKLAKEFDIKDRITVPQIIIDGKRIGGCDDLQELAAAGKLKKLLED